MKISLWDILAILALVGTAIILLLFISIFNNPYTPLNPFKPPTLPAIINYPTFTPTLRQLPPTWTPTPYNRINATVPLRTTATSFPSNTPFTISTFTITPTPTHTPTNTPTITPTPTQTRTFTPTRTRTKTPLPSNTPPPTSTPTPTKATPGYP